MTLRGDDLFVGIDGRDFEELRTPQERAQLRLEAELNEAERRAWDALSRYKFQMFGYWAAIWVHLNRIGNFKRPNPFKEIVRLARGPRV